ncbi:DUF3253 domain-containing protein [Paracoccus gahaiensis]|uniref:DUF3253 domain-containing protein n=1 Tax=Paracoccus gahaiensis TaxID=1706839 RepID=A0A4U0R666_9RHOB|nr:DUF3253 domain-containing protein [Paracoccus gahaiensis]TJZ90429.1 DUF3253 domain-containing protein [Paracoccus gahaiensis]
MSDAGLREAILAQVGRLRPGTTCCPSQIARDLATDWRPLMAPLRQAALDLAGEGRIRVMQKGQPAGPAPRGPIRLAAVDDVPPGEGR